MKERNNNFNFTPFNLDYFCQTLYSASDKDLTNIINDVHKEMERRAKAKKEEYLKKIREAITEATNAGYVIAFYQTSSSDCVDYTIDENSAISLDVELE